MHAEVGKFKDPVFNEAPSEAPPAGTKVALTVYCLSRCCLSPALVAAAWHDCVENNSKDVLLCPVSVEAVRKLRKHIVAGYLS